MLALDMTADGFNLLDFHRGHGQFAVQKTRAMAVNTPQPITHKTHNASCVHCCFRGCDARPLMRGEENPDSGFESLATTRLSPRAA